MTRETMIVTGGAGFIGSNFVRYALKNTDAEIIVVDKLTYAGNLANLADVQAHIEFIQADIAGPEIGMLIKTTRPTWVVNFAAETHVDRSIDGPRKFVETNLNGTFELLEAVRCHASDARFLQISTDEVFGSLGPCDSPFSEQTPYAPNSPYAATKAGADHLVRAYRATYGLQVMVTNCSNNYGPWQHPEKLIPLMILNAINGKPLPIYGDGLNVRDWLYVEDHCSGILAVLQRGRAGESYNIGGENALTNLEVVDQICAMLPQYTPMYTPVKTFVPDRPGHDRRYAVDAGKIRRRLGWTPTHTFEEGLRKTVEWYLRNPSWCADYKRDRLGAPSGVTR